MKRMRLITVCLSVVLLVSACQNAAVEKSSEDLMENNQSMSTDDETKENGEDGVDSDNINTGNETIDQQPNLDNTESNDQEENESEGTDEDGQAAADEGGDSEEPDLEKAGVSENAKLLESYSLDYNDDGYSYLIKKVIDNYVYMVRDNDEENKVQILGLDLYNLENLEFKTIYEGTGLRNDYKGRMDIFNKTEDGLIICTLMDCFIWIDPQSNEVVKKEDINNEIVDITLSHNEQMKSYRKEDLNLYLYRDEIGEVMIEEGIYIDHAGGIGITVHVPYGPKWSTNDTYLAYDIGLYEASTGPVITDAYGNTLLETNLWDTEYCWINDSQLALAQTTFDGLYMGVLDMNTYEFWYLVEDNNIDSVIFNQDSQMLGIYAQEPYHHLKIYDINEMLMYTEVPVLEEIYYDDYIYPTENKVFIIKLRRDQLIVDIYPNDGESKSIEPRIKKYPRMDHVKKWLDLEMGTIYGNQTIDPTNGSIDLFYKELRNDKMMHIGSYFGTANFLKSIPLVDTSRNMYMYIVNDEKLLYINGNEVGLEDFNEGLPDNEFQIKATDLLDSKYVYLISYADKTYTYYELYEKDLYDEVYKLVDSFKMNISDSSWDDFRVAYDSEGNLYYDYYDIDNSRPMIKCKKTGGELVEVMKDALQVTLLSGGELIQYTHITGFSKEEKNNSYQVLYDKINDQELEQFTGRFFESEDYIFKLVYNDSNNYQCVIMNKEDFGIINTIELTSPYILRVIQLQDELQLYVINFGEEDYEIEITSVPIAERTISEE